MDSLDKVIDAARQAPPAAAVPEGYALVPVEPTEAMQEAGEIAIDRWWNERTPESSSVVVYLAMLAAAERKDGES